jgi:hypothetical protein
MVIIGCDFHTRYQQIAMLDEATGGAERTGAACRWHCGELGRRAFAIFVVIFSAVRAAAGGAAKRGIDGR